MTQISITMSVRQTVDRQLYWIPHDRYRFDYDDEDREHSKGWAYNPAGTGPARHVAREKQVSMPEVYRFNPGHSTRIIEPFLDLLCDLNPMLSREKTMVLLGTGVAWCNTNWGVFDQPRLCGGAVVEGINDGNGKIWIKTMSVQRPAPTAQFVLDNFLSYIATEVKPDGRINLIQKIGIDGARHPARMIMLTSQAIYAPADEVLKLPPGFIPPSPHWVPS
jgi:hypothetical protein